MVKVGDIVRYLNSVGGGRVVKIAGNMAWVDDDGFETPVLARECVVVAAAGSQAATPVDDHRTNAVSSQNSRPAPAISTPSRSKASDDDLIHDLDDNEEIPGGDTLNVTLGYQAVDIAHLSDAGYEAYLINDSNYYLYFTYSTRADGQQTWITRYAGIIEPNIQLLLADLSDQDVIHLDHICVQIIAFKRNKDFTLNPPFNIQRDLDTTKFFKPHCFKANPYFDNKVLALELIKDDKPVDGQVITPQGADILAKTMVLPKNTDTPHRHHVKKPSNNESPLVIDLHIHELLDNTAGLSNSDMLNLQVDKFREVMDCNLKNLGKKIIFIHGKGNGVLRQTILKELKHRYPGVDVQDASFREYGFGATQVTIHRLTR